MKAIRKRTTRSRQRNGIEVKCQGTGWGVKAGLENLNGTEIGRQWRTLGGHQERGVYIGKRTSEAKHDKRGFKKIKCPATKAPPMHKKSKREPRGTTPLKKKKERAEILSKNFVPRVKKNLKAKKKVKTSRRES